MNLNIPQFQIESEAPLSQMCHAVGIKKFQEAVQYIFKLPYRRNSSKEDLTLVFSEKCGVCSTKHAALAALALENGFKELKLIVGIYQMNEKNTPGVGKVLEKANLEYMPEAHTYLVFEKNRIDITREIEAETSPFDFLLLEKEIQPNQIGKYKVNLHGEFLDKWRKEKNVNYSLEALWKIREDCIYALSQM